MVVERTPLGQFDGRLNDFAQLHSPVLLEGQKNGIHGAGDDGAEWAEGRDDPAVSVADRSHADQPGVVPAKAVEELHGGKFRRDPVAVDGHHRAILHLDENRAFPSRAETGHFHDGSGEKRGDAGVHSVPALFENPQARFGNQRMACGYYTALAHDKRLQSRRRAHDPRQVNSCDEH